LEHIVAVAHVRQTQNITDRRQLEFEGRWERIVRRGILYAQQCKEGYIVAAVGGNGEKTPSMERPSPL
jgi:hypothetical protein